MLVHFLKKKFAETANSFIKFLFSDCSEERIRTIIITILLFISDYSSSEHVLTVIRT